MTTFTRSLCSDVHCLQGAAAALDDGQHGHAHIRGPGLRAGEGRGGHHVLHPAPGEATRVMYHVSRVTCPVSRVTW